MPYTIARLGVPIGRVEQDVEEQLTAVAVLPLAGYDVLRSAIRRACVALANLSSSGPASATVFEATGQGSLAWAAALGRALELRDDHGALVSTDFIDLVDDARDDGSVAALVRRRDAHAPVPARRLPDNATDPDRAYPDA